MSGISRRALTASVADRLETVSNLTVFRGEVTNPPVIDDDSGRVRPYAVIWPSPGTPAAAAQDLADRFTSLDWLVQVTVAAGYQEDALAALDRVDAALFGWAPDIAGITCGHLAPPPGYDPGVMRRDDDKSPPRHYLPLLYRLAATR